MKLNTIPLFLILFLGADILDSTAQKRVRPARRGAAIRLEPLGFNCPEGVTGKPRPRVFISGGDITSKALELPQPLYPEEARAAGIKGIVRVEAIIEAASGRVLWARTLGGNPLLQTAVSKVVCRSRFSSTSMDGQPINVRGIITYRFGKR